ncbi:carotenoid 1,2-hydratase [Shewanella sp. NFH-SH190041]|uniref:lipocalin-like domain-containing protein n=1 Tax=Shewanella sp. NFH-SH190041 TaxID=2950245 RepID=UPI0021C387F7|nr:lipocalin-like domain-containing protein [Shewanella sp. NFH-SH190041]BDM65743.1 carotenoid 1,2-hydratase [Shewanella sp. NFH-SH190041]
MKLGYLLPLLLALLITGCDSPSTAKPRAMGDLLADKTQDDSYAKVLPDTQLSFPADHLAHPAFRQEWWYLTANLRTADDTPLGLQWTQFRVAQRAQQSAVPTTALTNNWQTQQLYLAHSAVTTEKIHYAAERWSRSHPALAGVNANPLRVFLDQWHWQSQGEDLFPATLSATTDKFSYQLTLDSQAPYQLQGQQGYSRKNAAGTVASHYYSQPFIHIHGEVTIDGNTQQVSGEGWLDREWSSKFLTGQQQGWDWFALRLDQLRTLMIFQLRGRSEQAKPFYTARLMYRDGRGEAVSSADITMTPLTISTIKHKQIPTRWQINVPSLGVDVTVTALNPQALMPLSIQYWEGPVTITGSHQGDGYMELTGY